MVNAHCKKGDVLFILTTSGGSNYSDRSKNIVLAAKEAKKKGVTVISFTGKNGGIIRKYSDVFIHIKNKETSYVQESHLVILHLISEILDKNK